ncbi:hypothetical protein [Streptomyces mobaraensis]|uniref:hypothetical protein n=1 Tax=Streptomyces mobaraensis TaxID=35621 RepID=UPI0012ACCE24|nr:hypothetical protein [Streptomyces mobaraensis]
MTKPDDLVHQEPTNLEAALIYGVRRDLDELVFFRTHTGGPPPAQALTKEH